MVLRPRSADPGRSLALLEHTEGRIQASYGSVQSVGVEAAANGTGLELLRIAVSRYAQRTEATRAAHLGLTLVACGQTAQKLRKSGRDVRLVAATSALDQIVLRM